jgi:hypothetical protein
MNISILFNQIDYIERPDPTPDVERLKAAVREFYFATIEIIEANNTENTDLIDAAVRNLREVAEKHAELLAEKEKK